MVKILDKNRIKPLSKRSGNERVFATRLYVSKRQQCRFEEVLWLCCQVWNAALSEHKSEYERYKRFGMRPDYIANWPTLKSQLQQLQEVRSKYYWIDSDIYSETLLEVLKRLDNAMKRFQRRKKSGENAGFPRFRKPKRLKPLRYIMQTDVWKLIRVKENSP